MHFPSKHFIVVGLVFLLEALAWSQEVDQPFDYFESGYGKWTVLGTAFGAQPAAGTLPNQSVVSGFTGKHLANSFVGGDAPTGRLISSRFVIEKDFISFRIGGGGDISKTFLRLLVDDQVFGVETGKYSETLERRYWNVSNHKGRTGRFEIVDNATGGWGHILVDDIRFKDSDRAPDETDFRGYLVVPVYFQDTVSVRPHSYSYYQAMIGPNWPGLDWYYKLSSGGRVSLAGSVAWDWTRLPGKAQAYKPLNSEGRHVWDMQKLLDGFVSAYPGVKLSDWYGVIFCPNVLDEFGGGAATWVERSPGEVMAVAFLNHTQGQSVWVHETSHHFGIGHVGGSSNGDPEDPFSVMSFGGLPGGAFGGLALSHQAFHKIQTGWIPPEKVLRMLARGDSLKTVVTRIANPARNSDVSALIIPITQDGSRYFTVEAKRFGGEDIRKALPREGVVIHLINTKQTGAESVLQVHPISDDKFRNGVWLPGETFFDPVSRAKVQVLRSTINGYEVQCNTAPF